MITSRKKWHLFIPIGIVAAVLVLGVFIWVYYLSPSNYLTLDVNPSIEIHTNRLNQVVSVDPVNDDAKQIMANYELSDRDLETVITNIVERMIQNGYLASDLDNDILITTDENNDTTALPTDVNNILSTYLNDKQLSANIILQSLNVTKEELQAAYESNLTIGKLKLIEALIKSDSTLTVEALSTLRISDLMAIAAQRNISLAAVSDIIHIQSRNTNVNEASDEDANAPEPNQTSKNSIAVGEQTKGQNLEDAVDSEDQEEDQDYEESEDKDNQDEDQKYEDSEDNDDRDEDQKYEDSEDKDDTDEDQDYEDSEDKDDPDEDQDYEDSEDNDDQDEDQDHDDAWENDDREDGHDIEVSKSGDQKDRSSYQNNKENDEADVEDHGNED